MSQPPREAPRTRRALEQRIRNLAGDGGNGRDAQQAAARLERAVLNTVVSQMVPPGVIKGGTAMKLRVGEAGSRFTPDFDAARAQGLDVADYLDAFADLLAAGWGGFTGRIEELEPADPAGVPEDYVMRPFKLVLSYHGSEWRSRVTFELGHDEIGSTANPEVVMSDQMRDIFARLGLPDPQPVPVLAVAHQVAQKLHACTGVGADGNNTRAHDLVDLQLLQLDPGIDPAAVAPVARRLFAARQSHAWPPMVKSYPGWDRLYAEAAAGLGVREDVHAAVAWANALVDRINQALT